MLTTILASLLAACVGAAATWAYDRRRQEKAERMLERETRRRIGGHGQAGQHARLIGWTHRHGNYDLVSLDKGETWWNLSRGGAMLTPADPALVAELRGWDALVRHAAAHGGVDFSKMSDEEEDALAGAGLVVRHKHDAA